MFKNQRYERANSFHPLSIYMLPSISNLPEDDALSFVDNMVGSEIFDLDFCLSRSSKLTLNGSEEFSQKSFGDADDILSNQEQIMLEEDMSEHREEDQVQDFYEPPVVDPSEKPAHIDLKTPVRRRSTAESLSAICVDIEEDVIP